MIELYHSLPAPYRKNAVWILHDTTVKAIRKLKDNNGNYIWQPSTQAGQPDLILNRPYYTSTFAPLPEAGNKAIAFGDFSYYWIATVKGVPSSVSMSFTLTMVRLVFLPASVWMGNSFYQKR